MVKEGSTVIYNCSNKVYIYHGRTLEKIFIYIEWVKKLEYNMKYILMDKNKKIMWIKNI